MTDQRFTIETPAGCFITERHGERTAHLFRVEYLADAYVRDANNPALQVVALFDPVAWLESQAADGITAVMVHGVSDVVPRRVDDLIRESRAEQ